MQIPSAFVCVDIATAYPLDGGMVSWVDLAFGTAVGSHNLWWFVINYVLLPDGISSLFHQIDIYAFLAYCF